MGKNKMSKLQQQQLFEKELDQINRLLFDEYQYVLLPTDPSIKVNKIIPKKCKFFSSKMVPLFLVFECGDNINSEYPLIFKCGDDLRQDQLIYSLFKIMDKLWLSQGLDLKFVTYHVLAAGCNANGDGMGFIEVVQ